MPHEEHFWSAMGLRYFFIYINNILRLRKMVLKDVVFSMGMKVKPECAPCLMRRAIFQAGLAGNGREFQVISAVSKTFANGLSGRNSAEVATDVHRGAYAAMGVKDPYLQLKIASDEIAERYVDVAEKEVSSSDDPLRTALEVAALGNIMDFGSGIAIDDPNEFKGLFNSLMSQGIDADEKALQAIDAASSVLYIFDNCGESQMDKVLIRLLRRMGKRITGVVRGEPILNDMTMVDARRTGIDKELDSILTTGVFAVGVDMKRAPKDLRDAIKNADLIISKGMANYESLSLEKLGKPIVYVLRTKCAPVAESIGAEPGDNVVRFFEQ